MANWIQRFLTAITTHKADPNAHHTRDYPIKIKPSGVRWTLPGWGANGTGTASPQNGQINYFLIFVEEDTTYIRIGLEVTTFAAGQADLRLFECVNGLPAALITDFGNINVGTNGLKEIVINEALTRGYYFLAIRQTCAAVLRTLNPTTIYKTPMSGVITTGSMAISGIVMVATAAWADPAPAPTALTSNRVCLTLREN